MNRCFFVLIITLLFLLNKSFGQTSIEFNYTIPADNNWKSVNQNGMGLILAMMLFVLKGHF